MNKQVLRLYSVLFLSLTTTLTVLGQKRMVDPRPLQKPDRFVSSGPVSLQARIQAVPGTAQDLRAAATVVGTAQRVPYALNGSGPARLPAAAKAGPAAQELGLARLERSQSGTVRWMQGSLGHILPAAGKHSAAEVEAAALGVLQDQAGILRLKDPSDELRPMQTEVDALGYTHARFEQVYEGVPVWGRDLYVHFDATGEAYLINGTYEPTPAGFSTTPALSADAALRTVEDDLKANQRWAPVHEETARLLGFDHVEQRLVLVPHGERGWTLAYEVSLHPNFLEWYTYLVDARNGTVLNRISRHCTVAHEEEPAPASTYPNPRLALAAPTRASGTFVDATGVDLNGVTQDLRIYQHDDGTFYQMWDLANLQAQNIKLPFPDVGGSVILSANEMDLNEQAQITSVTSADNTWADPASVSAHAGAKTVFEYFQGTFGRNAIDHKDQSVLSIVHVTRDGQPMDNAFWNGRVMAYGDGSQAFKPLAGAIDVASHEMSHGVIQHTADLIYQFQSGALNESFADVFGVMNDRDDFLLGEDIAQPSFGPALRDMLNPDNPQLSQPQPATMAQYQNLTADQDNGGVHVNSGIPNRAAALIIQSIGHDKTEQIYYRALDNYLTRNSQFGDARNAVEQAASDLHGASSAEVTAVRQAFDAVGITATTGTDAGGSNDIPAQTGGDSIVSFVLDNGTVGYIDMADPENAFSFIDPSSGHGVLARANPEIGDFAQLSTPRDGSSLWFINPSGQLAFIDLTNSETPVSVFTGLNLGQAGDLWNAAISPDGNYVALVSAYENDPTIYIYDGNEVTPIALEPGSTQDGISIQTIQYPDVVRWSPNPQVPRIAFDALNVIPTSGGDETFWSIYEIDFAAGQIYNLLPAQPAGVSVGNVTYSNTNPDLIAFNVFDETNTWDVYIGNFETGELFGLDLPSDGITDGQRPSFSPDDSQLAFTSPANNMILFYNGEQLVTYQFTVALFNPNWFAFEASGGADNQAPTASFQVSATSGMTPLEVTFDATASTDPDGGQITYRWDFGNGSIGSGSTVTHTFVATGTFTVTLTVTDSGGLSGVATTTIQVTGTVDVEDEDELPRTVALHPNHPNPFNPSTVLSFDLPAPSTVSLSVFDLQGRRVATLVEGAMPAGTHEVRFEAGNLPSGIYLARLQTGQGVRHRMLTLLR